MEQPIYLDGHATTPCDPRVVDTMLPMFSETFGNAASRNHAYGWAAEAQVERARENIAHRVGADPSEIIFTSGATESNNLAVRGAADSYSRKGRHIVTCATEHPSILDCFLRLERSGWKTDILRVDEKGYIDLDELEKVLLRETVLVSLMYANNETGVIHPIEQAGRLCHERGVLFHCDATQAGAWLPVDVKKMHIDLLSLTAHKMYGPKGAGALYIRRRSPRVRLTPLIEGGGHEKGLRSGTLNVSGIVGFGEAARIALEEAREDSNRIRILRDRLANGILAHLDDVSVNGDMEMRLPNNLNLAFGNVNGEALPGQMRELAISSGSACSSTLPQPSHVLSAMGLSDDLAHASIRYGLHRFTTDEDIRMAIEVTIRAVSELREQNPVDRRIRIQD
jgi:cysteine desulfurase